MTTLLCFALALALTFIVHWPQAASAQQMLRADHFEAASKKQARKKAKQAPATEAKPAKPKEPWELPMKVVIVRQSGALCEPVCQEWIVAQGRITDATPASFRKVLDRLGKRKLPVLLDSPGGSVYAALQIGRMLRKADLDVAVASVKFEGCTPNDKTCRLPEADRGEYRGRPQVQQAGYCASACPLILAGGRNRLAYAVAQIGVHQVQRVSTLQRIRYRESFRTKNGKQKLVSRKVISRKTETRVSYGLDKQLRKRLTAYLAEMGVGRAMLDDMEKAPFTSIYWLSGPRARELALVTGDLADLALSESINTCRWTAVHPRHCVERPVVTPPPAPGEVMIVARVRASGQCEPLCPEWIAADGVITPDTPQKFRAVLSQLGAKKLPVFLNSPRGDFDAALEIGRLIREKGLATAVGATRFTGCGPRDPACGKTRPPGEPFSGVMNVGLCGRECLLVVAGGRKRYAAYAGQTFFAPPETLWSRKRGASAASEAEAYLSEMLVSPDVIRMAQAGTVQSPVLLRASDLLDARLSSETDSPALLADPQSCKAMPPLPNCVARAKLLKPPSTEDEMFVVRMRGRESCGSSCPEWIMAEGIITPNTPDRFRKLLEQAGETKLPIVLNSAGGDLDAALEIGRMIRAKGLDTLIAVATFDGYVPREAACRDGQPALQPYSGVLYLWGQCSGSCLFILAGGTRRLASWAADPVLASPEWFGTRRTDNDGPGLIEEYLAEMGISPYLLPHVRRHDGAVLRETDLPHFRLSTGTDSPDTIIGPGVCMASPMPSHCVLREGAI